MVLNMKKHRHGKCGPEDLDCWNNKDKVLDAYKKYAGRIVTIYYNPDDVKEFYVKEIEEDVMLEKFKDNKDIKSYKHIAILAVKWSAILLGIYIVGMICLKIFNNYFLYTISFILSVL